MQVKSPIRPLCRLMSFFACELNFALGLPCLTMAVTESYDITGRSRFGGALNTNRHYQLVLVGMQMHPCATPRFNIGSPLSPKGKRRADENEEDGGPNSTPTPSPSKKGRHGRGAAGMAGGSGLA